MTVVDFILKEKPILRSAKRIKRLAEIMNRDRVYVTSGTEKYGRLMAFETPVSELINEMKRQNIEKVESLTCAGTAIYIQL